MIQILNQWGLPIIFAGGIALVVHRFILFTVLVSSHSMEPTLSSGDRLLTVRIYGLNRVKRQDIIAFFSREYAMVMVKRVIGLPGDSVTIQNDGFVIINGKKLQENYVHFASCRSGTFNVPKHQFMLLGDHRKKSTDSRSWAEPFIAEKDLLGRIVYRVYPLRRMKYLRDDCNRSK